MKAKIPPSPYADWVAWLDGFAQGADDLPPDSLVVPGDQRLGSYASDRVTERFLRAMEARINQWNLRFVQDVEALPKRPGQSLGPVLVDARRRLAPLRAAADSPVFPPSLRTSVTEQLEKLVTDAQRELEQMLRDVHDGGALLAQARRTPLDARAPAAVEPAG